MVAVSDEFNECWSVERGDPAWPATQYLLSLGYRDIKVSREVLVTGKLTGNHITANKLTQISQSGDIERFLYLTSLWDQLTALEGRPDFSLKGGRSAT